MTSSPVSAEQTGGTTPLAWDIPDAAGDANSLSYFVEGTPDTSPASDERADIRRVWVETTFDTVREHAADGSVTTVRHIPRALRFSVQTTAPARPATGPTLRFFVSTEAGGCYPAFGFKVRGPLSTTDQEVAEIRNSGPDGVSVGNCLPQGIRDPRFSLTFQGNVARMDFPFEALAGTSIADALAVGAELLPGPQRPAFIRVQRSGGGEGEILLGPVDAAALPETSYVIGSDVPADIDCVATPTEPACQASP